MSEASFTDERWDAVTKAVFQKHYSLLDKGSEKDSFNDAFRSMSSSAQKAFVKGIVLRLIALPVTSFNLFFVFEELTTCLVSDPAAARAKMHNLALQHMSEKNSNVGRERWAIFVLTLLVVIKASLHVGFGAFDGEGYLDALVLVGFLWHLLSSKNLNLILVVAMLPLWYGDHRLELARMIAIVPLLRSLRKVSEDSGTSRLLALFLVLLLCTHLVACAWFGLGSLQNFESEWGPSPAFRSGSLVFSYWQSFNWSLKALTQGPEGVPETGLEVAMSLLILFLGFSVYATIIGSIGSVLMNLDAEGQYWIEKKEGVERYVSSTRLPSELFSRIHAYYDYMKVRSRFRLHFCAFWTSLMRVFPSLTFLLPRVTIELQMIIAKSFLNCLNRSKLTFPCI